MQYVESYRISAIFMPAIFLLIKVAEWQRAS